MTIIAYFTDNGDGSSKALCPHPVFAKSNVWHCNICFSACKSVPMYSYFSRHNPCHASMMLPGTYWALVESILYSSWYLDVAHMNTDRQRLGESGVEKEGKGRKEQWKDATAIYLHSLAFWVRMQPFVWPCGRIQLGLCSKKEQDLIRCKQVDIRSDLVF